MGGPPTAVQTGPNSFTGYLYDAEGHRVAKGTLPSMTCDPTSLQITAAYFIGPDGETMTEIDGNGSWVRTEVSAAGQYLATYTPTGLHLPVTDWLGTKRLTVNPNLTLNNGLEEACASFPFGDQLNCSTPIDASPKHYTGKERDTESGLDYFGARYYGSSMGRMMSPDWSAKATPVPYAKLDNPQSLNLYSYVLNNPLRFIDPDGHYELNASNCGDNAKCQKKYDKAANKFEKQREKNLNSKNESIRNAAASYGAKGEANGVHVGFGDTRSGGTNGGVDISGSSPGNTNIQVTLDFSRAGSSETITHEGTHVMEDQKFLNSFDPATGGYNQNFNMTHFQTEFDAFRAGAMVNHEHGFGPNDVQGITNYINRNYPARILPMLVFPVSQFPAGVPDDEH